jgi:hypothetical protein
MGPVSTMTEDKGNPFPDEAPVLVRYPLGPGPERQPGQSQEEHLAVLRAERETWPWLLGTIEQQCGPDEWLITIEDQRLAVLEDGTPAPEGTPDDDLLFPQCYRDSSEIRGLPADPEMEAEQ